MPLTDAKIRNSKPALKPSKLADAHGLYLEVKPNGSKLWRYRYRIDGKENVFAIGGYPTISLLDARTQRDEARNLVKQGINPAHNRKLKIDGQIVKNQITFKVITKEWIDKKKEGWSPYYLKQVENFMEADVFPFIGNLPIKLVSAAHLLGVLQRIEKRGAETVALLVRQWSSAVFRYAVSTLRAEYDPAVALKGAIHRPKVVHNKPLPEREIPAFLKSLEEYGGYRTTYLAMRLLMLTFVRTKELRASVWSEFDLDTKEWRIPAERMKMRELHIVPLSKQALELLNELKALTGGQHWLFPNYRRPSECMTGTTLNRVIERMGYQGKFSAHGFRSTASTILNEKGFRSDLIERQLAHADGNKVRASYNQAEYLPERRDMLQYWADYLELALNA